MRRKLIMGLGTVGAALLLVAAGVWAGGLLASGGAGERVDGPPPAESTSTTALTSTVVGLEEAASAALARRAPGLSAACWDPSPAPQPLTFSVDLSFAADGTQAAIGISEPRAEGAPAIGQCLRSQAISLTIDPPGRPVRTQIPLVLPQP